MFYFQPYLGKIPILTDIFQMGWNHQLVCFEPGFACFCPPVFQVIDTETPRIAISPDIPPLKFNEYIPKMTKNIWSRRYIFQGPSFLVSIR